MASGHCLAWTSVQRVERVASEATENFRVGCNSADKNSSSNRRLAHRTRGVPPVGTRSKRLDGPKGVESATSEVASSSTHGATAVMLALVLAQAGGRFDMLAAPIGRSTRHDTRVGTWATAFGTGRPPRSPPGRLRRWARPPARMRSPARVARAAAGRAERPLPRACGPAPPPRARPPAAIAQWAKPAAWGAHPPPLGPPCALCACELRDHLEGRTSSATSLGPRGSEGR